MSTAGMLRFSGVVVYDISSPLSSILYNVIGHAFSGTSILVYVDSALRLTLAARAFGDAGPAFKICLYGPPEELRLGIVVHDLLGCRFGCGFTICGVCLWHLNTSDVSIQR